jgi:hypothetical protein
LPPPHPDLSSTDTEVEEKPICTSFSKSIHHPRKEDGDIGWTFLSNRIVIVSGQRCPYPPTARDEVFDLSLQPFSCRRGLAFPPTMTHQAVSWCPLVCHPVARYLIWRRPHSDEKSTFLPASGIAAMELVEHHGVLFPRVDWVSLPRPKDSFLSLTSPLMTRPPTHQPTFVCPHSRPRPRRTGIQASRGFRLGQGFVGVVAPTAHMSGHTKLPQLVSRRIVMSFARTV